MSENEGEQVSWNFASLLNMELGKLRARANAYFINRQLSKATETLLAMRMSCVHVLDDNEIKSLVAKEDELLKLIGQSEKEIRGFGTDSELKEKANANIQIYKKFTTYNDELMNLLSKYGFLGSKKIDTTKMKY